MNEISLRSTDRHLSACSDVSGCLSIDVLGPLRVAMGDRELRLSSRRQRALLVLMAVNANVVVTADQLIDQLWDGAPTPGAQVTLRSYISHIRRALYQFVDGRIRITTTDAGYRLDVDTQSLDVVRFRSAVAAGHRHLRAQEPREALAAFDEALGMWRGMPLVEIADHRVTASLTAELLELRAGAVEARLRALVDTGRHVEAVSGLESLVAAEPFREGPHELLMVALYRCGRSAEALEVHRRFRSVLSDQLGIDVSPRLNQLVTAILNRDPRLDVVPASDHAAESGAVPREESLIELVRSLLETLDTVSVQMGAVVAALADQLPVGSADLVRLTDIAVTLGPGRSGSTLSDALAS